MSNNTARGCLGVRLYSQRNVKEKSVFNGDLNTCKV